MIMTLQIQPVIMIDFADSACDHEAVKGKSERYHVLCSQERYGWSSPEMFFFIFQNL